MREELWTLLAKVPAGRVVAYGELGRALKNPASGYMVGRAMAACPPELPWWRVVGKSGALPIHKRDPHLAMEQQERLRAEGIDFQDNIVDMARFGWVFDAE
ncbi:MAG TPA: MGMT family protein [Fimbriimonadaceae bacterium]|nr:MGMT family protein [Fimbriimonadaceae bacterium]